MIQSFGDNFMGTLASLNDVTCEGSFYKIQVMVDNFGRDCYNKIDIDVNFTNVV